VLNGAQDSTFTASQVTQIVNGAVATGRIPPWRKARWHRKITAGGPTGANAVFSLLSMLPPGAEVAARWARDVRAEMPYADVDEDEIYRMLYPDPADIRRPPEPDRMAQTDARHAYLTSQAKATADPAGPPTGHGLLTIEHSHPHSDYGSPPGVHDRPHIHRADGSHQPGQAGHGHGPAVDDPTSAGIATRRRDPRSNAVAAAVTDSQLYDVLFGRPPDG